MIAEVTDLAEVAEVCRGRDMTTKFAKNHTTTLN